MAKWFYSTISSACAERVSTGFVACLDCAKGKLKLVPSAFRLEIKRDVRAELLGSVEQDGAPKSFPFRRRYHWATRFLPQKRKALVSICSPDVALNRDTAVPN
jgi:hypothetical protein